MRKNIFSMTPTRLSSLFRSFRVVPVPLVSFFTASTVHHQMVVLAAPIATLSAFPNPTHPATSIKVQRWSTMRVSSSHANWS